MKIMQSLLLYPSRFCSLILLFLYMKFTTGTATTTNNRAIAIPASTSLKKCFCRAILEQQTNIADRKMTLLNIFVVISLFNDISTKGRANAILFVACPDGNEDVSDKSVSIIFPDNSTTGLDLPIISFNKSPAILPRIKEKRTNRNKVLLFSNSLFLNDKSINKLYIIEMDPIP